MAESGIYEIVNLVNGKRYVGSAVRFVKRWAHHRYQLRRKRHHSRALQRAWDKYGETAFEFRQVECCSTDLLIEREQHHIDRLRPEYNCSRVAGSCLGVKWTEQSKARKSAQTKAYFDANPEARQRLSEANKGRPSPNRGVKPSPETIARMSEANREIWQRPGHREKMSAAHRGKKLPREQVEKIAAKLRGRKCTPEQRAAIAERNRIRNQSPEHRAKMSAFWTGRKRSPESIAKMAASKRGKVAHNKGKPMSAEQKTKQAAAMRLKWADPEFRALHRERTRAAMANPKVREKCRSSNLGRKQSPETIAKRAASIRATCAKRRASNS